MLVIGRRVSHLTIVPLLELEWTYPSIYFYFFKAFYFIKSLKRAGGPSVIEPRSSVNIIFPSLFTQLIGFEPWTVQGSAKDATYSLTPFMKIWLQLVRTENWCYDL